MAEQAYQFELTDNTVFTSGDNWESGKAGLFTGDKLALQLQQLEQAYIRGDVLLTSRSTALDGDKGAAENKLTTSLVDHVTSYDVFRLISLKHQLLSDYQKLLHPISRGYTICGVRYSLIN